MTEQSQPETATSQADDSAADPQCRSFAEDAKAIAAQRLSLLLEDLPDFEPKWSGAGSGHAHTVAAFMKPAEGDLHRFPSRRYLIPTNDDTGDTLVGRMFRPKGVHPDATPDCPIIILLHGLGGHSESVYIRKTALSLLKSGRDVFLFNFRGAGESAECCKMHNHPGRTEDLHNLYAWLHDDQTPNVVACGSVIVGYSLGGNILLKFLAEDLDEPTIHTALTISAPLDLHATSRALGRVATLPYRLYLLAKLRSRVVSSDRTVSDAELRRVRRTTSIYEFDRVFTAPRNGFDTVEDYYEANSAVPALPDIRVPTLLLYAQDDPFVPPNMYDDLDWNEHAALEPQIVPAGGHVGFIDKRDCPTWHDRVILHVAEKLDATDL